MGSGKTTCGHPTVNFILLPLKRKSFLCVRILLACVSVDHTLAWCSQQSEEGIGFPETGVTDSRELLCECWKPNLGLPEGRPVLLIYEPPLQPLSHYSLIFFWNTHTHHTRARAHTHSLSLCGIKASGEQSIWSVGYTLENDQQAL